MRERWRMGVYDFHRGRKRPATENTGSHSAERRAASAARMRRLWAAGVFAEPHRRFVNVDWAAAQVLYDGGMSTRELAKTIKVARGTIDRAIRDGSLRSRSRSEAMKLVATTEFQRAMWTPERRAAQAIRKRKLLAKHPELHPNRILAGNRQRMSYPERLAFDALTRAEVKFEHNARVKRYYVDFLVGTIGIEVDGEQWHDRAREEKRDAVIATQGVRVVRFKAKDVIASGGACVLAAVG